MTTTPDQPTGNNNGGRRRVLLVALILLPVIAAAWLGYYFVKVRPFETTDDAFIDGRTIPISPKVAGHVLKLPVTDNQRVKKGDLLVQIDPRDFEVRLDIARANLAAAQSRQAQAEKGLAVAEAQDAQDHAAVAATEAEARRAQADYERYRTIESRAISKQQLDAALATSQSTTAALEVARKKASTTDALVGLAQTQIPIAATGVKQAEVAVRQAELELSYATIIAPEDGWVTHRTVEVGQFLQVGQELLAVVTDQQWVTANFKETQVARMKPDLPVTLEVDALPDKRFTGHIDSIQAGTGAQFSLLPPENAVGNYVKVVQRVPVKIVFDAGDVPHFPLGASVVPAVKVR